MPKVTTARTKPNRVKQLLDAFPALCFFYSLSRIDAQDLEGAYSDPRELDGMRDARAQTWLDQCVAERGIPALNEPMELIIRHIGSIAMGLSWGHLAEINRPQSRLFQFRECFRPLAQQIAHDPRFDWWWNGATTPVITAKDIGTGPVADLGYFGGWSNQPRGHNTLQTTQGPVGNDPSTLLWCVDNDTILGGDPRTTPFNQSPTRGRGFQIKEPSDWVKLVSRAPHRVEDTEVIRDWTYFLGEQSLWATPAWDLLAPQYDWIESTLSGFLLAAYLPIHVNGHATAIIGWNPGATIHFGVNLTRYLEWANSDQC